MTIEPAVLSVSAPPVKEKRTQEPTTALGQVVFFECLMRWHVPLVVWYVARGYAVRYKHLQPGFQPTWRFLRRLERGLIELLNFDPPLYRWFNHSYEEAFDHIEDVYKRFYERGPLIGRLEHLFHSNAVHVGFKKALLERLSEDFYYHLLIERIRQQFNRADRLTIIFANPLHVNQYLQFSRMVPSTTDDSQLPSWHFPWWLRIVATCASLRTRVKIGLGSAKILGWMMMSRLRGSHHPSAEHYMLGLAVISPTRELHDRLRSSGFLADGELIKQAEVILIPVTSLRSQEVVWLKRRGFNVSEAMRPVSWETARRTTGALAHLLTSTFTEPSWLLIMAITMIREFAKWTTFVEYYHVKKFVTYSDHVLSHIPRNIILQQQGTEVWHYHVTANMSEALPPLNGNGEPLRFDMWGYLYYDVMVCWGERFIRYFKRHHQHVGRYVVVGCLWSEHVRLFQSNPVPSILRQPLEIRGWRPGQKIAAVFPTWYHANSLTHPEDGLAFLRGIEQLMADFQEIFVILKEKHARWFFANRRDISRQDFGGEAVAIYQAYEAFDHHPRCLLPGHAADTSEITALSDLVISFPFTSVTIEAMGAGVKGLYFDPLGKYRGGYYDAIPGLVAHSYEELKERVLELLYDTPPHAYQRYLEAYVKGDSDPFLDGQAITRFRKLLINDENELD